MIHLFSFVSIIIFFHSRQSTSNSFISCPQCGARCGSGNKTRDVLCIKSLAGGIFATVDKENCLASDKPSNTQPCEREPCSPEWYMTSWSQVLVRLMACLACLLTPRCHKRLPIRRLLFRLRKSSTIYLVSTITRLSCLATFSGPCNSVLLMCQTLFEVKGKVNM